MKIENQVCTLEQAKRLKELGVIKKSLFYYSTANKTHLRLLVADIMKPLGSGIHAIPVISAESFCNPECYSAFTVAELGIMIDWNLVSISPPYKDESSWWMNTNQDSYWHDNEANARAQVLIYLLENNLITAEEVNQKIE